MKPLAAMLLLLTALLQAQSIKGVVVNDLQQPLDNVLVKLPALNEHTSTDLNGSWKFDRVPGGKYLVEFSRVGFRKEIRTVSIGEESVDIRVTLLASPLELSPFTVTASPEPSSAMDSPQLVTTIEGRQLNRERGQSLGQTLERLPGVSGFSGGALSVKPVIRGLSAQRVLVTSDGTPIEGQTWDEPQSPESDAFNIDRIEVLRGPASVLYGSDAIGGVVNVVKPDLFAASSSLSGESTLNLFSNDLHAAANIFLHGARGSIFYRGNVSGRYLDDYHTPNGKVFNTGGSEISASAAIGLNQSWGKLALEFAHFGQHYKIAPELGRKEVETDPVTGKPDTLDAAPSQEISHDAVTVSANLPFSSMRLEVRSTVQLNSRKEEGVISPNEDESAQPEAQLDLTSATVDIKLHHSLGGTSSGALGLSFLGRSNEMLGRNPVIPGFEESNLAAFLLENVSLGPVHLSGGARFDARTMNVHANTILGNPARDLKFSAVTGTAGLAWNLGDYVTIASNVGRGWRAPTVFELFVNGADEGSVRYKVGNPSLEPEQSLNVETSIRYSSPALYLEAALFRNTISKFIYLEPTGTKDGLTQLDRYALKQADATLKGGELSLQWRVSDWLMLNGGYDMTEGTNDATGAPLPLVPASRIKTGLRISQPEMLGMTQAYVSVSSRIVSDQNRPGLFETRTGGYSLIDLGFGGTLKVSSTLITLDLAVENLFDKAYVDHLSRYKKFALNPGRSIDLRASVPFDIY